MPIYEYECPSCGVFEVNQKISDDPLGTCPDCGEAVKKLMSMTSFHLKGGGWYKDGYGTPAKAGKKEGGNGGKESGSGSKDSSSAPCGKCCANASSCPAAA